MPTAENAANEDATDKQLRGRIQTIKKAEFIWPVKYKNTLPDIPFDPKYLRYPFDKNRFVQYKQTSLEKNYSHDLLTEADLGIKIDLVDVEENDPHNEDVKLDEEDERLLEDELNLQKDMKRSACHNRHVAWLKKTEYISTDFNRYGAKTEIDKAEVKVGYGIKKNLKEDIVFLDREEQIKAINRTFEAAKRPILRHPTKKDLKPVDVLPVFPDFDLWKIPFAQVMFDADPAPISKEPEMSQALIRGIMDESGEQFVAYFLPTKSTCDKRRIEILNGQTEITDEEYEFHISREYSWDVMNKATKGYEENYFFVWRDDMVCYNELETRVKLAKRRNKSKKQTNSKLFVRHRPLNESELALERSRLTQLERPIEEEEEVHQEEPEPEESPEEPNEESQNDETADKSAVEKNNNSDDDDDDDEDRQRRDNHKSSKQKPESSSSSSSSSASSSSESSDDDNDRRSSNKKPNAKEIFGSESDSD